MDLNRLTEQSQEALRRAQELALRRNHQGIDAAHLLAALVDKEPKAAGLKFSVQPHSEQKSSAADATQEASAA